MKKELKTILYAEDDEDIRTITTMALEAVGGFVLFSCSSGKEALEKAPRAAADLILLDVMMPGMDGPETLKGLRKLPETSDVPVIFMTAKVQTSEIQQYKDLGAVDVIAKPFDPMTLSEQIKAIWSRL